MGLTIFRNDNIDEILSALYFATNNSIIENILTQTFQAMRIEDLEDSVGMLVARIDKITQQQNNQNG